MSTKRRHVQENNVNNDKWTFSVHFSFFGFIIVHLTIDVKEVSMNLSNGD